MQPPPHPTTTIFRHASQVLTLAGSPYPRAGQAMSELGILADATIVVDDGRIAWIGAHAHLDPKPFRDTQEIDCRGKTLMPAFVDSHTHLVWGGDRKDELEMRLAGQDYEAILAAGGGILSSVRQTRAATEQDLVAQCRTRIERMRRMGTTTFEIKSGYGLDLDTEMRQLHAIRRLSKEGFRVRATCLAAHAVPQEARASNAARSDFVDVVAHEILPAVAKENLADYCDVFCDRGAFTFEESCRVLEAAQQLGFGIRVHAHEFGHTDGVKVATRYHAASADHLLYLNDGERASLREAEVVATLLPGTSLVLGKPFADGRALVDSGVAVAVATDCNPGSCGLENLALVLALACYGCRLSPAEAICATTHNAAASLGYAGEVGRLEVGMSGDILILDTADYRDLVYHAGSPLVQEVYASGARVR
ncbi:MAG: imidazolonepropionase [Nannocystaceae bacterium]